MLHQQQALRKPLFFCKNNAEEKLFSPCGYCYANKKNPVAGVWWKLVQVATIEHGLLALAQRALPQRAQRSAPTPNPTSTRFILLALLNRPEEKLFISMVFADERLILQACSRKCPLRTLPCLEPPRLQRHYSGTTAAILPVISAPALHHLTLVSSPAMPHLLTTDAPRFAGLFCSLGRANQTHRNS